MDIKQRFGHQILKLRLEKGLSQEALALKSDIDRTYLPGIEKGVRNVSIVTIEKLSKALEIPLSELMEI